MTNARGDCARRRRIIIRAGVAILFCVCASAAAYWAHWRSGWQARAERLLSESRTALQRKEFERAESLATRIDRAAACWPLGQMVAGEAAMRTGRAQDADRYFRAIPRDGSQTSVLAAFSLGELARDGGRLSEAERQYLYVLEHQPDNTLAHTRIAFLLGAVGRRRDSLPHLLYLLRNDAADLEELVLLGDLERPMDQREYLRRCARAAPDEVLVRLGLAACAGDDGHSSESRRLLLDVIDQAPDLMAAQAMLGELLVDDDDATLLEWNARLPPAAGEYAEIWLVRGLWARRRGSLRVASRCFWELVRIAPTHRRGNYQLGQVLVALGESSGAEFAERAAQLNELGQAFDNVLRRKGQDEVALHRVVELLESTGRFWEACGWAALASRTYPAASWPQMIFQRLSVQLSRDTPQTMASANLALKYDLSQFPDFSQLLQQAGRGSTPGAAPDQIHSRIRFEEASGTAIDFVYDNGSDPLVDTSRPVGDDSGSGAGTPESHLKVHRRPRMFEQTGGGVAVLDFDGDGWPDLFFTQGGEWKFGAPTPTPSPETTDRLYRNAGGLAFVDVTRTACLVDSGFGQGCAAGDFDNDGFPDLYVANIGRNRLLRNNGDGTFADATEGCDPQPETWTASCVIVDLNADGLPDLFDVTYLTGEKVYELVCKGHGCSPRGFQGIPDRLFLNRGDGTFEFVPHATPDTNSSKGLGVVAVELSDRRRPWLFIANDQVPNFLLHNLPSGDSRNIRLQDDGFASGLAFNGDGRAVASMGIAADDVDGDGRVDFFVSTFKDEPRVLFIQDAPGTFVDGTSGAGLLAAGLPFVGWGAQFLDADCDGDPDIVVANGHVDDYRDEGGEYHMPPQLFRNVGRGRFIELKAPACGAWFGRKLLGRGLARLDWNRDGRMDFAVSNIGDRASLVTNQTTKGGRFLNLRLHARETARDAIGSVVEVTTDRRRWVKQLIAGDGYMASNERLLQFGLGDASSIKELRVQWPSGSVTAIPDPPLDVTLELVEGATRGVLWRGAEPGGFQFAEECLSRGQ
jgi:tetratricopeptide (TPR) repeat protein